MYKLSTILLLLSCNLFSQEIMFSENKLDYFFNPVYFPEYDSIIVYNTGSNLLLIDSIYSKNDYGYSLIILYTDSSLFFNVFNGYDPLNIPIESNDSAKLIFSYPDFCPICTSSLNIAAFSDTLVIHSNSLTNSYSYISVEGDGSTDIKDDKILLNDFVLYQNYPNPFNPVTTIRFEIPYRQNVELAIYDILGREVKLLYDGIAPAGLMVIDFNAQGFSSGVYIYRLKTDEFISSKKLIILK